MCSTTNWHDLEVISFSVIMHLRQSPWQSTRTCHSMAFYDNQQIIQSIVTACDADKIKDTKIHVGRPYQNINTFLIRTTLKPNFFAIKPARKKLIIQDFKFQNYLFTPFFKTFPLKTGTMCVKEYPESTTRHIRCFSTSSLWHLKALNWAALNLETNWNS